MGNNNTKIKYLQVQDKIYKVTALHLFYMSIEAEETGLSAGEVPPEELFDISGFKDYRIRLSNAKDRTDTVNMEKWKQGRAL